MLALQILVIFSVTTLMMDLASMATPNDRIKLQYIRNIFYELLCRIKKLPFEEQARRDALPIIQAASVAEIYNGEYDGVIRKYYAFRGDHTKVWFTLDLFTAMPDDLSSQSDKDEMHVIMTYLVQSLLREVRAALVEELRV